MTDATITPPGADADASTDADAETAVSTDVPAETTTVSVYVPGVGGEWVEHRLEPGKTMEITLEDGSTAAIVDVDPRDAGETG